MLSKPSSTKKGDFACQCLGHVDMHMYAKLDQNILCGLRVMNIFTNCLRTDSDSDYSTDPMVVQSSYTVCNVINLGFYWLFKI